MHEHVHIYILAAPFPTSADSYAPYPYFPL